VACGGRTPGLMEHTQESPTPLPALIPEHAACMLPAHHPQTYQAHPYNPDPSPTPSPPPPACRCLLCSHHRPAKG
jgi:hypothetical protein